MALQVWLPLNGSIYNQGLNDVSILSRSITYGTGKIASQGAKFNGDCNQYIRIGNTEDFQYDEFTWSVWIYPTSFSVKGFIISHGRDYSKYGVNILVDTNGALTIFSEKAWSGITTLILNTWYHIAVSLKENTIKCYLNGNLVKTFTSDVQIDFGESHGLVIGKMSYNYGNTTSYFPFNGIIQDVRIYDESLSPKQIKLLSQGLVCHYPMGNIDGKIGGRNLLSNSDFIQSSGEWVVESGASSLIEDSYFNKKVMSFNLTGGNKRIYKSLNNVWDKNQKYSVSFYAKASISGVAIQPSRSLIDVGEQMNLTTSWKKYHTIILSTETVNGGTLSLQVNNSSATYYITNIKLEKGTSTTPWTPAPEDDPIMYDNVIYDTSGYGNNGSITDSTCPTWSSDTPRYKGSYAFNGNKQYVNCGASTMIEGQEEITINCWAYMDDWTKFNARLFSCTEGGGYNTEGVNSSIKFSLNVFTTSNKSKYAYTNTIGGYPGIKLSDMASGWHMITCVYKASVGDAIYLDGKLYEKKTYTSYGIHFNKYSYLFLGGESSGVNCIAPYFNGKLSDFRIYATALDNQTIEELYKVGVSVDNNGNLMLAGEVIEE